MAKRRSQKWNYGFAEITHGGPLTRLDAQFAAEKRAQGIPEAEIAKMLGVTLASLRRGTIVDEGFGSSGPDGPPSPLNDNAAMRQFKAERDQRNQLARKMTTWRAHAPNPLAKEASLPPDLLPSRRRL